MYRNTLRVAANDQSETAIFMAYDCISLLTTNKLNNTASMLNNILFTNISSSTKSNIK